ncbi:homeobox-leucine zipper protein REVOLUTA-like isoform X2 [Actinidia eriantha]|uniref:homeobox-leucine zipper protein REVOLUTA-like isoform X2 n=1 Tax=Actinidia eriantha TaxID=165200 RepID=UPI00258DA2BC|nr:homeobox-leucine zipper protein REVOLUTA-like isoform X2 [Actinidia eriantha]
MIRASMSEMSGMGGSHGGRGSKRSNGSGDPHVDCGKYTRYTAEQVEVLEKVFAKCPKPTSSDRQKMIHNYSILSILEPKQIKVWFQNRRCREKQKKEANNIQSVNKKLTAANKLLMEENDRLQKQVSHLVSENEYIRQQVENIALDANDTSCEPAVNSPQYSLRASNDPSGLFLVAEETMAEFFSKATGTLVDWVQLPGMKLGSDHVGTINISRNCNGVAARASGLVSLEPALVMEILKDRSSWCRDCKKLEVVAKFPAGNGGTIELIYMQVCEKSMSSSGIGPGPFAASQFTRAKMLASGYLIRPYEGGGSTIHIVDHLDLEALTVPEMLRPLYESSELVAQRMTAAALHYIRKIALARSPEVRQAKEPPLWSFSQRLSRGFNDAINGFDDDGWSLISYGAAENLIISINSTRNIWITSDSVDPHPLSGGILCVKASTLLQNVSSSLLVQFLREHRSEWADLSIDAHSAASLKTGSFTFPGLNSFDFSASTELLGHTIDDDEILEMIRLEGHVLSQKDAILFQDIYFLQICNGIKENAVGACSELIFAPLIANLPADAPLLSSGFRVLPLDSETCQELDMLTPQRITNLESNLKACTATSHTAGTSSWSNHLQSVLIVAFQFPFESHILENIATMAREYVVNVIHSVQRVALAIKSPGLIPHVGPKLIAGSPEAATLASWICRSYSLTFGAELLRSSCQTDDLQLKRLWYHHDAILCCSFKSLQACLFANQAALDMLETTLSTLQDITLYQIFDNSGTEALKTIVPKIMQQGFGILSTGTLLSMRGREVSYEQAIAWKVFADGCALYCLAFAFINRSFL